MTHVKRRVLVLVAVTAVVSLVGWGGAGSAVAAEGYGQLARFGGFDSTGNTPGKFVYPVGFAVDPSDGNAVYVLDRVVSEETPVIEPVTNETTAIDVTLQYRLQKLNSSTGAVIASALLPLEHYTASPFYEGAHPLWGLAVDSANHRVYTLMQDIVSNGEPERAVPVLERVLAWSTEPAGKEGKELVKAPGFKETDTTTGAALVAGPSVLEHIEEPSKDIYLPQTLTVDNSHNIVIEAQDGVSGTMGGPLMLQQVRIQGSEGEKVGALGEHFIAEALVAPKTGQVGDGLFTTQSGSLGLDVWASVGDTSRLATILPSIESKPEPKLLAAGDQVEQNKDAAASIDRAHPIMNQGQFSNSYLLKPYAAGSPITQLTSGLYAAYYAEQSDSQQGLEFPGNRFEVSPFWLQGRQVEKAVGREGVRLFAEDGKISTTLGAEMEGEPCYMGFAAVALAAGANEAVFALVQPNPEDGNKGDEVAEFGPDSNAATRCPTDSRSLEINKEIITSSTPIPVTVTEGAKVKFGVSLSNPGADTPFEFEWVFGDGHTETKRIEPPKYKWPEPSVEYSYATPGIKHASVRVYGAFGTSETTPVEVMVSPATPPVAGFSSPGGPAEEAVPFETTGSIAPPGTHIERYEWNFGDGQERSTPSATTHTYAKPGTYTVTLKVYDLGRTSEAVSHSVVISESAAEKAEREARELKEREEHEAQVKAAEAAAQAKAAAEAKARAEAEAAAQAKVVAEAAARKKLEEEQARRQSSVKPPTRAQLLAKALTACRKLKPAKKRTSCAKAAQKRYGPPKKGGHKGGKGKK